MKFLTGNNELKVIRLLKVSLHYGTKPDGKTLRDGVNALLDFNEKNGVTFMDYGPDGVNTFQPRGVLLDIIDDTLNGPLIYSLNRCDLIQIKTTNYNFYYFNEFEHVETPNAKNILETLESAVDYVNQRDALKNKLRSC